MTEQLSPEVRAEAADAAYQVPNAHAGLAPASYWGQLVNAVVSVVAPEIERPLQARIAELVAESAELEAVFGKLEDENLRLRDQAGDMAEELETSETIRGHRAQALSDVRARITELEQRIVVGCERMYRRGDEIWVRLDDVVKAVRGE